MSVKFPLSDFFQSSGNAAAVFSESLRDQIATFACTLWANYPAFITESTVPGASFARGFMNQMCSPIQAPVPAPSPPFVGAQCPTAYFWRPTMRVSRPNSALGLSIGDEIVVQAVANQNGPISSTVYPPVPNNAFVVGTANSINFNPQTSFQFSGFAVEWRDPPDPADNPSLVNVNEIVSDSFTRVDGMPDNCGSLPADYPVNPPSSMDLTTNITIINLDGLDSNFVLVYNKLSNQYNFPMNFKLNGVNVTLDIGGITIYGPPQITEPTSGNDLPVPGSDGGDDGTGGTNDETYPDSEYPTVPDLTVPTSVSQLIEYVVCTDGVISAVSDTLKVVTANIPYFSLIIDILVNILTDVCEISEAEAIVGLPEYYGLRPGVERPAIVYLYKEFINDTWQDSTYSSTVTHPSAAAIANIMTVVVPDKTIGTIVYSVSLTDGSRIKTSGDTDTNAQSNFNFLLNQVESSFIPVNVNDCTTVSEYPKLQVKTVKCRQIEYYPNGKAAGVNPLTRRVIDA
jgi:hypothetical protein